MSYDYLAVSNAWWSRSGLHVAMEMSMLLNIATVLSR